MKNKLNIIDDREWKNNLFKITRDFLDPDGDTLGEDFHEFLMSTGSDIGDPMMEFIAKAIINYNEK